MWTTARRLTPTRLYVDRAFTLHGIGTVVTGTLWSGAVGAGDALRVEPGGREVRVRSVQVHDEPVERAEAGQRVALALPGVERRELRRGDALVTPGRFRPSYRLDVALEELEPVGDGTRLHVHHGTAAVPARVVRAGRFAQLRLAAPIVAARGDRIVLRTSTTVGGGRVLDPRPPRHADAGRFERVEQGEAPIHAPVEGPTAGASRPPGSRSCATQLEAALEAADPLDPGVPAPTEPWARDVLALLPFERRGSRLYRPGVTGSLGARAAEAAARRRGARRRRAGRGEGRGRRARTLPRERGSARPARWRLRRSRLAAFERARSLLLEECRSGGRISLARFRDLVGCGRRDAQLLLERFDADGLTRRVGDARVLRQVGGRAAVTPVQHFRRMRVLVIVIGLLAVGLLAAAGTASLARSDETTAFDKGSATITTRTGKIDLVVEIAETDEQRQLRPDASPSLGAKAGMVFLYRRGRRTAASG